MIKKAAVAEESDVVVFSVVYVLITAIILLVDFSAITLDENTERLLYSTEVGCEMEEGDESHPPFGNSAGIGGEINAGDLSESMAKEDAERFLDEIYNAK